MADHNVTAAQVDAFEAAIAKPDLTIAQIAKEAGVAKATISRWKIRQKDGTWDTYAADIRAGMGQTTPRAKAARPVTESMRRSFVHLKARGWTLRQIGDKYDISYQAVHQHLQQPNKLNRRGKQEAFEKQVNRLKDQGLGYREVAAKLGVSTGRVSYVFYDKPNRQGRRTSKDTKENLNGSATADYSLDKKIAIGIAYAEVERFIGVLSERLGLSSGVLRAQLSELLGHSPVR